MCWPATGEVIYVSARAAPGRPGRLDRQAGRPAADLASLIGERVAIHFAPIEHRVEHGKGTLRVDEVLYSEMAPYTDTAGRPTQLVDTLFTTIPGSPAYVAKASIHQVHVPEHGMTWEFTGRNAIQSDFHLEA
jgi:hypothetical protein